MALIVCIECGKEFSDRASACPNCGCPIEEVISKQTTIPVSNDEQNSDVSSKTVRLLRDYLEEVRKLEADIYTMDETIKKLRPQIKELPIKKVIHEPSEPIKPAAISFHLSPAMEGLKGYGDSILYGSGEITSRILDGDSILARLCCAPIDGIKATINANKTNKEYEKQNIEEMDRYEREVKHYQEIALPDYKCKLAEEDKRFEKELAQVTLFNEGIEKNISLLEDEKKRTETSLKKLYDTGIIFPKYRGIVPVTMFCEYMDSGRRKVLEGIHGMYDLYETELLGQRIIEELGKINKGLSYISYQIGGIANQLTGIARNQIMLYEEIAKGNEIARKISQDTSALLEQSASLVSTTTNLHDEVNAIKISAQMSAYSNEVAAHRLNALAKIEEYEFSLRHPSFPSP